MASLEPKLFCGVAFIGREVQPPRGHVLELRIFRGPQRRMPFTPQYLSTGRYCWPSNASTPTEPTGRCFCVLQTESPKRETIRTHACCVKRASGVICVQNTDLIKYQTPIPAPARNKTNKNANNAITSLNLRYLFLLGGASEPCGKYGGGV